MSEDKKTGEKMDSDEKKISAAIARLEGLSCLQLDDELRKEMEAKTLGLIAGWFDTVRKLDTKDAQPLVNTREFHKGTEKANFRLSLREDVADDDAKREELLANATESEHGFFTVPKVIE